MLVVCGSLIYGIMQGIHDKYGIMMKALVPETGVSYQDISLCNGVGAFLYGFVQPLSDALAIKKTSTFVMKIGIVLILLGTFAPLWAANLILTALAAASSFSVKEVPVRERRLRKLNNT